MTPKQETIIIIALVIVSIICVTLIYNTILAPPMVVHECGINNASISGQFTARFANHTIALQCVP